MHLRRRDFLYSHSDKVPSLKSAARQIRSALAQYNLTSVFVATDAPAEGFRHCLMLPSISLNFVPEPDQFF